MVGSVILAWGLFAYLANQGEVICESDDAGTITDVCTPLRYPIRRLMVGIGLVAVGLTIFLFNSNRREEQGALTAGN